ncbi:Tetratricopeptide-like helical domain containing protein [Trema orientale]|uniref:Tetratricopeptide-like helical domain containing protein n=1 Tax=Trema orientale TaxID=63057 RepID=A0A2P5F4P9_TREOI|nr:Tetratricopeptide-like helical domain containing protein [Trema orientale]
MLDFALHQTPQTKTWRFLRPFSSDSTDPNDQVAVLVQNIIYFRRQKSTDEIEQALDRSGFELTEELVLNVLRRHRSDWKPAYVFFNWVCKRSGYSPGSGPYNEIIDILGKMRRFEEVDQVFDEMSKRNGLVNEVTYGILLNRYAAAHKVEEAIDVFKRRKEFGLEVDDLVPFQTLLLWICRYKHVELAENLFYSYCNKRNGLFIHSDIKTWNIILNGWCVRGNVHEAKRFWNDIIASGCRPDLFTCGTFINALTKKGKLGTALRLFRAMWGYKGCNPDVAICNCIINALCFKKRIPQALQVFREMSERGCQPNVATYNTLIKYLCRIQRMEKVYEILDEMEQKRGNCLPNHVTYSFLLKSLKRPEEVPALLERMERSGCGMIGDMYNLMLKLYMDWDCQERVRHTWNEMERNGLGPDQQSYTIMVHGYCEKGRREDALRYFRQMKSKGMRLEPRTEILVNSLDVNFDGKKGA